MMARNTYENLNKTREQFRDFAADKAEAEVLKAEAAAIREETRRSGCEKWAR